MFQQMCLQGGANGSLAQAFWAVPCRHVQQAPFQTHRDCNFLESVFALYSRHLADSTVNSKACRNVQQGSLAQALGVMPCKHVQEAACQQKASRTHDSHGLKLHNTPAHLQCLLLHCLVHSKLHCYETYESSLAQALWVVPCRHVQEASCQAWIAV